MTTVGAEQPRPAPDEYLDALRAAGRRDWIPGECRVDGDLVTCPRDVLRRLLLAAAVAIFKQRLLERALREHEDLYERLRERLEAVESELGWLEEELVEAERHVERLLSGLEEVEALRRELEGVRARAERVARLAESWVTVWECRVHVPHPGYDPEALQGAWRATPLPPRLEVLQRQAQLVRAPIQAPGPRDREGPCTRPRGGRTAPGEGVG